jgi:hypothetical protein
VPPNKNSKNLLTEFTFRTVLYYVKCTALIVVIPFFIYTGLAQAPVVNSFSPTYGGQSSFIHIKGKYFTNATAVTFGGTPATMALFILLHLQKPVGFTRRNVYRYPGFILTVTH